MIQEPKSGSGSDIPDTRSTCMTKVTGLEKCEWKEKLAAFRSDGCTVMTVTQNGIWGLLQQDASYFASASLSVRISLSMERTSPSGNFRSGVILNVFSMAISGTRRPSCLENDVAID